MKTCPKCEFEVQDSFSFCPNCGNDLSRPIVCKECNYSNEPNSKFCQECGTLLFDKTKQKAKNKLSDIELIELPPPTLEGITIEFPFTSAQSFDFAVKEASRFETFEQFGEGKKAIYRITIAENEVYQVKELLNHLKGWRKRTVYVNGEKVLWDSVFSFIWSYERKLSSYKPEYYCFGYENEWEFNLWGCMRAAMPFTNHAQWFMFGKWLNNTGDWQFDKERIRHELAKNLHEVRFCPALDSERIKEIINALPEIVNPNKNKNWKFIESYSPESNALVIKSNNYGFEQTIYYKGVCPNGMGFIKDIKDKLSKQLPDFIKY
jgi:hypothetical protein